LIDIAKKKLPLPLVGVLVYLSYCAEGWFVSRGMMAYYGEKYGFAPWFANDIWAFFTGGIVPFALFWLITSLTMRLITARVGGGAVNIRYGVCITVIVANIVLFALKFMYIALPLQASVIDIILVPTLTIAFVALYLWYAFGRGYVDKTRYRTVVTQVFGSFLSVYGVITALNLFLSVA